MTEHAVPSDELIRLKATDKDHGANGRVEYRLAVETDVIFVDPDSGSVRLEKALDREQQPKHRFLIMAVDRGKPAKLAFTNLTILVDDINDNPPVCGKAIHRARLFEDSPTNQLVLCLAAYDADQHQNAELNFEMANEAFRVDRQTGCIFTNLSKPLDFELQSSYEFNVTVSLLGLNYLKRIFEVTDSGTPTLSTTCPVEIRLIDVNENQLPPRFTETVYEASVEENRPKHTEILTVKAIDPDGTSVVYELVQNVEQGLFSRI